MTYGFVWKRWGLQLATISSKPAPGEDADPYAEAKRSWRAYGVVMDTPPHRQADRVPASGHPRPDQAPPRHPLAPALSGRTILDVTIERLYYLPRRRPMLPEDVKVIVLHLDDGTKVEVEAIAEEDHGVVYGYLDVRWLA